MSHTVTVAHFLLNKEEMPAPGPLQMDPDATVRDLLDMFHTRNCPNAQTLQLVAGGKPMNKNLDMKLKDCNIGGDSGLPAAFIAMVAPDDRLQAGDARFL